MQVDLGSKRYHDQVMGCWMGKNCGGTLGAPLEKLFGEEEPFAVKWYPRLEPEGIPNDDLEMQLVWLKAMEEMGTGLGARELAQYWLDHIGYNFDEYGLSKTNLRLGLLPPVSGAYNNWFRDCMGCPIRSEIWACIAPGAPRLATRYALEDASVDHGGGESVWGELFNAAMEAAAFVVRDRRQLIRIARTYVKDDTLTARAVDTVVAAHAAGADWLAARRAVLRATPHHVAQFSPINLGFQVLGLLYGRDFGHTICLTVNCGYDTDCTGATVGAVLGIISGAARLPRKWTKPLGEKIATNASWGGLKHVLDGPNPIPADLPELTDRTVAVARRVMANARARDLELEADPRFLRLAASNPMRVFFPAPEHGVWVDYGRDPVITPDSPKRIVTVIDNPHTEARSLECVLEAPCGWKVTPAARRVRIDPGGSRRLQWRVLAPADSVRNSNSLTLRVLAAEAPSPPAVSFVLVGARALLVSPLYRADPERGIHTPCPPETRARDKDGHWKLVYAPGNALPPPVLRGRGIRYVRACFQLPQRGRAHLVLDAECPAKLWVDGRLLSERETDARLRPALPRRGGSCWKAGRHEVLVKLLLGGGKPPQAHLIATRGNKLGDGLVAAQWIRPAHR